MSSEQSTFLKLRAIVAVPKEDRVRCQEAGCNHSVYAAIHVVQVEGRLMVLGSTCFAKRFGSRVSLGPAEFGAGKGRTLTNEERLMLIENTEALLSQFEAQAKHAAENGLTKSDSLARGIPNLSRPRATRAVWDSACDSRPGFNLDMRRQMPRRPSPWKWQKETTSIAIFISPEKRRWVRVQHSDGSQRLVPWPAFAGWETELPNGIGSVDTVTASVAVSDIVAAIAQLQAIGYDGPIIGTWATLLAGEADL